MLWLIPREIHIGSGLFGKKASTGRSGFFLRGSAVDPIAESSDGTLC